MNFPPPRGFCRAFGITWHLCAFIAAALCTLSGIAIARSFPSTLGCIVATILSGLILPQLLSRLLHRTQRRLYIEWGWCLREYYAAVATPWFVAELSTGQTWSGFGTYWQGFRVHYQRDRSQPPGDQLFLRCDDFLTKYTKLSLFELQQLQIEEGRDSR